MSRAERYSARNVIGLLGVLCFAVGCATDDHNSSGGIRDRQDSAVKDPFSYGPSEGKTTTPGDPTRTSKRDDSAKGEWDRFWNP